METWQKDFIHFIFEEQALKFGEFETKSGRLSPYFFNAGGLNSGDACNELGKFYAKAIKHFIGSDVDIIYGPAYKGIPLSVMTSMQLEGLGASTSYCFNRKEAKDHGEKGNLVGKIPDIGSRVVIVDDVITAGTSIRETMELLKNIRGITIKGVVVAIDRQEKGVEKPISALQEIKSLYDIDVFSIVKMEQIIEMLRASELQGVSDKALALMQKYRTMYGA